MRRLNRRTSGVVSSSRPSVNWCFVSWPDHRASVARLDDAGVSCVFLGGSLRSCPDLRASFPSAQLRASAWLRIQPSSRAYASSRHGRPILRPSVPFVYRHHLQLSNSADPAAYIRILSATIKRPWRSGGHRSLHCRNGDLTPGATHLHRRLWTERRTW